MDFVWGLSEDAVAMSLTISKTETVQLLKQQEQPQKHLPWISPA
jgi:hypothetical protein